MKGLLRFLSGFILEFCPPLYFCSILRISRSSWLVFLSLWWSLSSDYFCASCACPKVASNHHKGPQCPCIHCSDLKSAQLTTLVCPISSTPDLPPIQAGLHLRQIKTIIQSFPLVLRGGCGWSRVSLCLKAKKGELCFYGQRLYAGWEEITRLLKAAATLCYCPLEKAGYCYAWLNKMYISVLSCN